jgi:hypothetical protein
VGAGADDAVNERSEHPPVRPPPPRRRDHRLARDGAVVHEYFFTREIPLKSDMRPLTITRPARARTLTAIALFGHIDLSFLLRHPARAIVRACVISPG